MDICMTMRAMKTFIFILSCLTGVLANWQLCNTKCYYFGNQKVSFAGLDSHCLSMSQTSKPLDLLAKLEATLQIEMSSCNLNIPYNEPYWINKLRQDCRTVVFTANSVQFRYTPCSSQASPICEASDASLCKGQNRTADNLNYGWFRLNGEGPSYKLSQEEYSFCDAKNYCKTRLGGQMMRKGGYTFLGFLGNQIGLTGTQNLDFWIKDSGLDCHALKQTTGILGKAVKYVGPFVHTIVEKPLTERHKVLCMKNLTSVSTTRGTTTPMITPKILQLASSATTTQTTKQVPITTITQTTEATSTKNIQITNTAGSTKPTQTTQIVSTKPAQTTKMGSTKPTRTTKMVSTKPTQTTKMGSTKTAQTTKMGSTKPAQTIKMGLTKPTQMAPPMNSGPQKVIKGTLASFKSEPVWLKVGEMEYFVNYNSDFYPQISDISVDYFNMFPSPLLDQPDTFWIGAHTVLPAEPTFAGITYQEFEPKMVKYSLKDNQVQNMWRELRRVRKTDQTKK